MMLESANAVVRQLDELRARLSRPDVKISISGVEGAPGESIPRIADEERYDLIVVGTHGRTGLRHILLGSIAEAVVRHAHRPVLTIHEPPARPAHAAP